MNQAPTMDRVTLWRTCKSILSRCLVFSTFLVRLLTCEIPSISSDCEGGRTGSLPERAKRRFGTAPLQQRRERGEKNVSIRENKRSREKKNQVHVDTPIFIVEREREREAEIASHGARYRSIVVYSTP